MKQIVFGELKAILLDFIDHSDGFLFLRMIGEESTIGAIWAKLAGKEGRGKKWLSEVKTDDGGIVQQKGVIYKTLKTRLSSNLIDMAIIHPILTTVEDKDEFFILTYEEGMPESFFDRLNKNLVIPLKKEWAEWLWSEGLKSHIRTSIETRSVWDNGKYKKEEYLDNLSETPICSLSLESNIKCYKVNCSIKLTWLKIIREKLNLHIPLERKNEIYQNHHYTIFPFESGYALGNSKELLLKAPSVEWLLVKSNHELGLNFILEN